MNAKRWLPVTVPARINCMRLVLLLLLQYCDRTGTYWFVRSRNTSFTRGTSAVLFLSFRKNPVKWNVTPNTHVIHVKVGIFALSSHKTTQLALEHFSIFLASAVIESRGCRNRLFRAFPCCLCYSNSGIIAAELYHKNCQHSSIHLRIKTRIQYSHILHSTMPATATRVAAAGGGYTKYLQRFWSVESLVDVF
jgi:hypothetical protein